MKLIASMMFGSSSINRTRRPISASSLVLSPPKESARLSHPFQATSKPNAAQGVPALSRLLQKTGLAPGAAALHRADPAAGADAPGRLTRLRTGRAHQHRRHDLRRPLEAGRTEIP